MRPGDETRNPASGRPSKAPGAGANPPRRPHPAWFCFDPCFPPLSPALPSPLLQHSQVPPFKHLHCRVDQRHPLGLPPHAGSCSLGGAGPTSEQPRAPPAHLPVQELGIKLHVFLPVQGLLLEDGPGLRFIWGEWGERAGLTTRDSENGFRAGAQRVSCAQQHPEGLTQLCPLYQSHGPPQLRRYSAHPAPSHGSSRKRAQAQISIEISGRKQPIYL